MTAQQIFEAALESGVFLYVEEDRLKYRVESGRLSEALRAQLQQHKHEIVAYLQRLQTDMPPLPPRLPPIEPRGAEATTVLSFEQQRMWMLQQLGENSSQYYVHGAFTLHGALRVDAFEAAIRTVVQRHQVLRTVYLQEGPEVRQRVRDDLPLAVQQIDFSGLPAAAQEDAVISFALREMVKPFDLENELPLRMRLVRLAADRHAVLFDLHHIAADGWSMPILEREFAILYRALCQGVEAVLPPLPLQYRDFAAWQRSWLQGEPLEQLKRYWARQLAALPRVHALPLDRPRPRTQDSYGDIVYSVIDVGLLARARAFCVSRDVTLFMLLETAFAVLLSRCGAGEDIVVGTPVAGRTHPEIEPLIGLFVNTLVLRNDLSGAPTFAALLARNRGMILDAYAQQQMPFDTLVEILNPPRSAAYSPLFQIILSLHNEQGGRGAPMFHDLRFETLRLRKPSSKFELGVNIFEKHGQLELAWAYRSALFDRATIERLTVLFRDLLIHALQHPDTTVHELNWRAATTVPPPPAVSAPLAHHRFEAQARRRPQRIAVQCADAAVDYATLDAQANQVAHFLLRRGVRTGARIGAAVRDCPLQAMLLLGVLKAGACFVLLHEAYAPSRRSAIRRDARASLWLVDADSREAAGDGDLPLDAALLRHLQELPGTEPAEVTLDPSAPACVLYREDEQGRLEALTVAHSLLAASTAWIETPDEGRGDEPEVQLAAGAATAAAPLPAWFAGLLAGATVVEPMPEHAYDPAALSACLEARRVNTLRAPLPLVEDLLPFWPRGGSVRRLVLDADLVSASAIRRVHDALPEVDLHIAHGLAGASLPFAVRHWDGAEDFPPERIGQPLAGHDLQVLDPNGLDVPDGLAGHLHLTGPMAAPGGQARLGTGRKVRRAADGGIDDLTPPSPLRAAALASGWVHECVVVPGTPADEDTPVAFLRPHAALPWTAQERRVRLQQRVLLAGAGIPSTFHVQILDDWPLTADAGIDVDRLLSAAAPVVAESTERALTPTEARLAAIWRRSLGEKPMLPDDNFFALGGHSLLVVVVIKRISETFDVDVPMTTFMENATLAALSSLIDFSLQRRDAGPDGDGVVEEFLL